MIVEGQKVRLSVPFHIKIKKSKEPAPGEAPVLAVDLGINTGAVGSIVHSDGTVTAKTFLDFAADIDRRDKRLKLISVKAKKSMGKSGKLTKGFCRGLYRKAANINKEISQRLANDLVKFALAHGVTVIVFENMKGFRPSGGRKGSNLRQRFHGWLHRRVVRLVEQRMEELGLQVRFVSARGTSKYAFDGSGPVKRDKKNYSLATFSNGKKYNCDLSASYNIGARYWYRRIMKGGKKSLPVRGQDTKRLDHRKLRADGNSAPKSRMPITLSTLWAFAHQSREEKHLHT